jgi:hypothetical protein
MIYKYLLNNIDRRISNSIQIYIKITSNSFRRTINYKLEEILVIVIERNICLSKRIKKYLISVGIYNSNLFFIALEKIEIIKRN